MVAIDATNPIYTQSRNYICVILRFTWFKPLFTGQWKKYTVSHLSKSFGKHWETVSAAADYTRWRHCIPLWHFIFPTSNCEKVGAKNCNFPLFPGKMRFSRPLLPDLPFIFAGSSSPNIISSRPRGPKNLPTCPSWAIRDSSRPTRSPERTLQS